MSWTLTITLALIGAARRYQKLSRRRPGLDWAVFNGRSIVLQTQSANFEAGIKIALKLIKILPDFSLEKCIICMEHTGIYNAIMLSQLNVSSFPICGAARRLESSLQIKKAGGLQRGKSDRIDAQRIAEYAFRFRDRIRLWQPPHQLLQDLTSLSSLRQRLLSVRSQLQQPIDEQAGFVDTRSQKLLIKNCQASLKAINSDLEHVD